MLYLTKYAAKIRKNGFPTKQTAHHLTKYAEKTDDLANAERTAALSCSIYRVRLSFLQRSDATKFPST